MGDSDFQPPGAPKPWNWLSWNLVWLITSRTRPHTPKVMHATLGVYRGGWVKLPPCVLFYYHQHSFSILILSRFMAFPLFYQKITVVIEVC